MFYHFPHGMPKNKHGARPNLLRVYFYSVNNECIYLISLLKLVLRARDMKKSSRTGSLTQCNGC